MKNKELQAVEKQIEDVDRLKSELLPRIADLQERRAELEDAMSEAVLDDALGLAKSNGKIETLRERIRETTKKIDDAERLRDATENKQGGLRKREQELRLKVMEAEFLDLVPQVDRDAEQYLDLREAIRQVVENYNTRQKRANYLRAQIQEYRNRLQVGQQDVGDLPGVRNLPWNDQQTFISRDQLRGLKPW